MIFDLIKDYVDVLAAMPIEHPRRSILNLLDEAIRRDAHFLYRHPTTFFQCAWNTCWRYDFPAAPKPNESPECGLSADSATWKEQRLTLEIFLNKLERERNLQDLQQPYLLRTLSPPSLPLSNGTVLCEPASPLGHSDVVHSIQFSSDGRRFISSSLDETVRVWDAENGKQLLSIEVPKRDRPTDWIVVTHVKFSPDDRLIAGWNTDRSNSPYVWEATSGRLQAVLEGHTSRVYALAFSPDSKQIATCSCDKTARIWEVSSGKQPVQLEGHTRWVTRVAFSSDGKQVVSSSIDKTLRVWNSADGQQVTLFNAPGTWILDVAFSPDDRRIVGAFADNTVRIWDIESGACVELLEETKDIKPFVAKTAAKPYQLISRADETVLETRATGESVAWFPMALSTQMPFFAEHPSGRKWATAIDNQIMVLEMVDEAITPV